MKDLSNEDLFRFYKEKRDASYFGELYHRYIPMIYGLCLKYLGNEADAQDAVMDLFEDVVQKIFQYDIKNFHTWLYSVAKNHCLHRLRKQKQPFFTALDERVMENDDFFTLLDKEKTKEELSALQFCMDALNEEQQNSIRYFYYESKSYADIVSLTGYTLKKVKSYIQNGKRNLKNCVLNLLKNETNG